MKRLYLILIFWMPALITFSQGEAGPDKVICKGGSVEIGSPDKGYCYVWDAAQGLTDRNKPNPVVSPTTTTTYKLTVVGQDFSFKRPDEVVITVVENNTFNPSSATIKDGATPKVPLSSQDSVWGYTDDESIDVEIMACSDGTSWHAILTKINGNYSEEVRLLPRVDEVTGIGGNTTRSNFCKQVSDLKALSLNYGNWYMINAIKAHEDVHATRLKPALDDVTGDIEALFEGLSVPDNGQTQQVAISQIKALPDFNTALAQSVQLWDGKYVIRIANDHQSGAGPPTLLKKGW